MKYLSMPDKEHDEFMHHHPETLTKPQMLTSSKYLEAAKSNQVSLWTLVLYKTREKNELLS